MELRVIQCQVGQFNLLGNEKSLSFSIGLFEKNVLIKDGENKARLYYSGDPEEYDDFKDAIDDLENVFEKCYAYANRVFSSTDYVAECILFAKLYNQHYEAIDAWLLAKRKKETEDKIARLQKQLEQDSILPDLSWVVNNAIEKEVTKYSRWLGQDKDELDQLRENSEKYNKLQKRIDDRIKHIDWLKESKIVEQD